MRRKLSLLSIFFVSCFFFKTSAQSLRREVSLNSNWLSIADEKNVNAYSGFEKSNFSTKGWMNIDVPHNWDKYEGYQRKLHGNKHGYA